MLGNFCRLCGRIGVAADTYIGRSLGRLVRKLNVGLVRKTSCGGEHFVSVFLNDHRLERAAWSATASCRSALDLVLRQDCRCSVSLAA